MQLRGFECLALITRLPIRSQKHQGGLLLLDAPEQTFKQLKAKMKLGCTVNHKNICNCKRARGSIHFTPSGII